MSDYSLGTDQVEAGSNYKIVVEGKEVINTIHPDVIKNLKKCSQLVSEVLFVTPERYQHPSTGIITDGDGNISHRYERQEVGILKAPADEIKGIKSNIRITRNH